MPPKKVRRKAHSTRGKGILGSIWNGVKKVHGFIKDNKLISRGLSLLPDGRAQTGSKVAGALGYGQKRVVRRKRGGASGVKRIGPGDYRMRGQPPFSASGPVISGPPNRGFKIQPFSLNGGGGHGGR